MGGDNDLEFFGVTIKCKSAHLAALLNSSVTEDVVVVGKRAMDVLNTDIRPGDAGDDTDARNESEERADVLAMICEAD